MTRSLAAMSFLSVAFACGCASKTSDLAGIEVRLDHIEAELREIRAAEATRDAATTAPPPGSPGPQGAIDVPVAASDAQ